MNDLKVPLNKFIINKKYIMLMVIIISSIWVFQGISISTHADVAGLGVYKVHTPPSPYWSDWGWDKIKIHDFSLSGVISNKSTFILLLYISFLLFISSFISKKAASYSNADFTSFERAIIPFSGFIVIYLTTSAINRLISLFLPAHTAAIASLLFLAVAVIIAISVRVKGHGNSKVELPVQVIVLSLSAMLTIQFGFAFITGDRTITELHNITLSSIYGPEHIKYFPLLSYHYDELSFLFPVFYWTKNPAQHNTLLISVWVMQFMVKLSAFSLTYFCIRSFRCSRFYSLILVILIFFGALSFNPMERVKLFDSSNPIYFTLHPGRVISSLSVFWVISALRWVKLKKTNIKFNPLSTGALALLSIGATTTTFNVSLICVSIILCWAFAEVVNSEFAEKVTIYVASCASLAALPLIYFDFSSYSINGWLYAGLIISTIATYFLCLRHDNKIFTRDNQHQLWKLIIIISLGTLIGFTFGNMGVSFIAKFIPELSSHGLIYPQAEMLVSGEKLISSGAFGSNVWPIGHQFNFANFSARYGVPVVLSAIATLIVTTYSNQEQNTATRSLLLSILTFIVGLFIMDYVKINNDFPGISWDYARQFAVRTRMVEAGFYATILVSLSIIGCDLNRRYKYIAVCLILVYTILPNARYDDNVMIQAWVNAKYFLSLIADL
ncbi:hypothetical protein QNN86_02820 [Citrobacter sp. C348]|uniref:hypothetical protein n=1 Tax=Citrobacter sp. C348 TaxID=3048143 RepID=UPI0039C1953D